MDEHYFNETRGVSYTDFPRNTREDYLKSQKYIKPVVLSEEESDELRD